MPKYILAHDLGTSGNKASLFTEEGKMIGSEVASYDVHYFNGTWAEQNADDWWQAVCHSTKSLINRLDINPSNIAVVSFSGQMMGCLCVDETGQPLREAIIWADQRAQEQVTMIEKQISQKDYYQIVGHRNTASYGLQKFIWIKDNEPEIYEKTYKVLNAKDYIVAKLTGNFYTDYSDGNGFGCFDINNLQWSDKLIDIANIDKNKLPELKPSTFQAGKVTLKASEHTGLLEGTPVVIGGGDGVTASVGAGSIEPGKTYCSVGTSAWITTAAEKPIFDEEMRTVNWAHVVPGLYAPNGTMQTAGESYSWLTKTLFKEVIQEAKEKGVSPYELINEEIEKVPIGSNGVLFLPYLLGERAPRWDAYAKGAFIGLKSETSNWDLARSVLEGVSFNLAIVLEALRKEMVIDEITIIGGGAKGPVWRQIMSEIYNADLLVPEVIEEASSMGAAVTGGVGIGLFEDFTVVNDFIEINDTHHPDAASVKDYEPYKELFEESYQALQNIFVKLSKN